MPYPLNPILPSGYIISRLESSYLRNILYKFILMLPTTGVPLLRQDDTGHLLIGNPHLGIGQHLRKIQGAGIVHEIGTGMGE